MNKELLLKVKKAILKEPFQFEMDDWFTTNTDTIPNCGTACCIAGWTITLDLGVNPAEACQNAESLPGDDLESKAARLLQISDAHNLFYLRSWPKQFRDQFFAAEELPLEECQAARAKVAADYIDWFIKEYESNHSSVGGLEPSAAPAAN